MIRALLLTLTLLIPLTSNALSAESYIVMEQDGTVLLEKDADTMRSIASITKLFTVRNALPYQLEELIEILPEDMKLGKMKRTPLKVGKKYTRGLLIELALVSSDNVAAMALGRADHETYELPPNTQIVEASGLDPLNQSTARDLANFARENIDTNLAKGSVQQTVTIDENVAKKKKPDHRNTTNSLLNRPGWSFHLSKTGYIKASGGCLVVVFEAGGRLLTAVILGSKDIPTRWRDLYELRKMLDENDEFASPVIRKIKKAVTRKKLRNK